MHSRSGWNNTVRLYRPCKEVLNGTWKILETQPANQRPTPRFNGFGGAKR